MAAIKPNRVRYQLFLPEDLSHRFEALASQPGAQVRHIELARVGLSEPSRTFHGRAVFIWEAAPGQVRERVISGDTTLIHIPPGLAHAVTNPGPELLYLLAWREGSGPGPGEPETIPHHLDGVTS